MSDQPRPTPASTTTVPAPWPVALTGPPASEGSWAGRPAGVPSSVPPPTVPLSFLAASSLGLVGCGIAFLAVRHSAVVDPTSDPVVAAVHLGVLATLTMGILGATHQFTPVITGRPLRSVWVARATFLAWVLAAWLLPVGVALESTAITEVSGAMAGLSVVLLITNLARCLSVRGKGVPVTALRLSLLGAVLTSLLGVAFVANRGSHWFTPTGVDDVAMGVIGLFGWLGVTYVGVAEKLWPMFLLAHPPGRRRWRAFGVASLSLGAALLASGLGWSVAVLAVVGAGLLGLGAISHLASLVVHLRHRRRPVDLYVTFVATSGAWLVAAGAFAIAGQSVIGSHDHAGRALVAASLACTGGWLLVALVGHAHKVVPFVVWSALRSRGLTLGASGRPLMFADLYQQRAALASYALVTTGTASLTTGLAGSWAVLVAIGGILIAVTGVVVATNLVLTPWALWRHFRMDSPADTATGIPAT